MAVFNMILTSFTERERVFFFFFNSFVVLVVIWRIYLDTLYIHAALLYFIAQKK